MLQVGESQSLDPSEKALPYPFETRVGRPTEVLSYIMNSVINDRLPGAACFFIYNCVKTCYNPNVARGLVSFCIVTMFTAESTQP